MVSPPRRSHGEGLAPDQGSLQSQSQLIIGVDFGTTFSGVAYSHSGATSPVADTDPRRIAHNISVIRTWPNPILQYIEKIPTLLAYHTDPPAWGGGVRPKHEPQVAKFKLGLEPSVPQHYGFPKLQHKRAPRYGTHHKLNKKPVDFVADYLTCIYRHLHETFLRSQYGDEFLRNQQMSYIITVPAIWSDFAKDLTRQAACRAGFPDDNLVLISEPEAAGLYCATTCNEVDLIDGDIFLVCDAGGGTVVSIHRFLTLISGPNCISNRYSCTI